MVGIGNNNNVQYLFETADIASKGIRTIMVLGVLPGYYSSLDLMINYIDSTCSYNQLCTSR